MCTKKRLPVLLSCAIALGLLILSGPSCVIYIDNTTSGDAWPTTESEPRAFVTPESPSVEECLQGILGAPPYEITKDGLDAIRDWIAHNIEYKSDEERVAKQDDWQTPEEALKNPRVGDCEDFSLLFCSLLRAYGIGPERVFVAIGVDGRENAHAFVIENWYLDGKWRMIEPQAPAQVRRSFPLFPSADSQLDRYEIIAAFNDVYYYDESFPWGEDEANSWTLTNMATAVGNLARGVSQLVGYLLGLLSNEDQHDATSAANSAWF